MKNKSLNSDHFPAYVENFIIVAIILVVIHTIIDDLSIIYHWSHKTVVIIAAAGFLFDILFSVEFIARSAISHRKNQFMFYFKQQRGWIDAISSIPLLLLVSGPAILTFFFEQNDSALQMGFLSILKSAKAIRVTRILRLIRVIKLFGKIQNTDSQMTNRHIGIISTISTVTLVIVLVITNFTPFARIGDHHDYLQNRSVELNALLQTSPPDPWLVQYLKKSRLNEDIITMKAPSGQIIFSSPQKEDLAWTAYGESLKIYDYEILLSYHLAESEHAKANMMMFFSILGMIFSIMFLYAKIFAQQITDPLYVMNKGLREWNYNLTVKENKNLETDEVFQMAAAFNKTWLPLKNQIFAKRKKKMEEQEKSVLKMDDIF